MSPQNIKNIENINKMHSPVLAFNYENSALSEVYTQPVNQDGAWRCCFSKEPLTEMVASLPENTPCQNFEVMEMAELSARIADQIESIYSVGKAKFIDAAVFNSHLESLCPLDFIQNKTATSFCVDECLTGDLYRYCVHVNGQYFSLIHHLGKTQAELLAICTNPKNILEA